MPRLPEKIKGIFKATRTHATNLAKFVTIYKVLLLSQKKMNGGKERDLDSLIAGGLGGWWCFGQQTAASSLNPHDVCVSVYLTRRSMNRSSCTSCLESSCPSSHVFTALPPPPPPNRHYPLLPLSSPNTHSHHSLIPFHPSLPPRRTRAHSHRLKFHSRWWRR